MPLQLIEQHRRELADIGLLLTADLAAQWTRVPVGADVAVMRSQVMDLTMDLTDYYGTMAAGAGADWYDEMRATSGVRSRYTARPVVPLVREQVEGNVGYAIGPLVQSEPNVAAAMSRLDGALQRLVTNAERETILTNAERDPGRPRWYRYASANACAFCAMLASRGAAYRSEASSGFDAHDHCGCFPVPVFPGQRVENPHIHDFMDDYMTGRDAARKAGDLSTKSILAEMRARTGRR